MFLVSAVLAGLARAMGSEKEIQCVMTGKGKLNKHPFWIAYVENHKESTKIIIKMLDTRLICTNQLYFSRFAMTNQKIKFRGQYHFIIHEIHRSTYE